MFFDTSAKDICRAVSTVYETPPFIVYPQLKHIDSIKKINKKYFRTFVV